MSRELLLLFRVDLLTSINNLYHQKKGKAPTRFNTSHQPVQVKAQDVHERYSSVNSFTSKQQDKLPKNTANYERLHLNIIFITFLSAIASTNYNDRWRSKN